MRIPEIVRGRNRGCGQIGTPGDRAGIGKSERGKNLPVIYTDNADQQKPQEPTTQENTMNVEILACPT
jgi:hypothetical protein